MTDMRYYKPQKPYQDTKPIFNDYRACPYWVIEERVGKSKHWNQLSEVYHSYDRAINGLISAKFQFPLLDYRIIQVEKVVFMKTTITHET